VHFETANLLKHFFSRLAAITVQSLKFDFLFLTVKSLSRDLAARNLVHH